VRLGVWICHIEVKYLVQEVLIDIIKGGVSEKITKYGGFPRIKKMRGNVCPRYMLNWDSFICKIHTFGPS
jgi:hypothetical protein